MSKMPTTTEEIINKKWPIDIIKYRWVFLGLSVVFLIPGIAFLIMNAMDPEIQSPLRLGIDFRGGTLLEYGFEKPVTQADLNAIREVFDQEGYTGSVIQIQEARMGVNKQPTEIGGPATGASEGMKPSLSDAERAATAQAPAEVQAEGVPPSPEGEAKVSTIVSIRAKHMEGQAEQNVRRDLTQKYGNITLLQKNSIGPSLASELMTNALLALVLAYLLIVGYLTFRFQFDFAVCAMLALVHDSIFVVGMFAIFGKLFHTEIDSLFITAILTAIGFSVHDTIVVFDRIRENYKLYFTKKVPFDVIANMSVNQTLVRSLNTSFTALLTMLAMYFFGGETTKDFVLAIILGLAVGTYSSIFNASVLLAMWRSRQAKAAPAAAA